MAVATVAYFLMATWLKIREASDVLTVLRRQKKTPASISTAGQTSD
jgi:hypothetical protein